MPTVSHSMHKPGQICLVDRSLFYIFNFLAVFIFIFHVFFKKVVLGNLKKLVHSSTPASSIRQPHSIAKKTASTFRSHQPDFLVSPCRTPISNVGVNNVGSADQAGFTQWIVVKTAIKSLCFFTEPNLVPK